MLGSGYEIDDVVGKYLVITVRDDGLVIPLDRSYVEIMVGDGQIAQFLVEQHRVAMQLHPYHQQFAVVESAPITRPVVVEGHSYLIGGEILRIYKEIHAQLTEHLLVFRNEKLAVVYPRHGF